MNSIVDISSTEQKLAERVNGGITNALTVSDRAGGVQFANATEVMEFSKLMAVANSGVRQHLRGNPGACLAICVQAVEWGMSPFAVANKSYFVNNQIAFESQLVQAVILRRAPIRGRIKFDFSGEGQLRVCRAWARLREDDEIVDYVSPAIKDIKVKNSPLWVGDPDQQLAYFAGRSLCRRHFPDVLLGVFDQDELSPDQPITGPARARDVTPRLGGSNHSKVVDPLKDEAPADTTKVEATPDQQAPAPTDAKPESAPDAPSAKPDEQAAADTTATTEPEDTPRDLLLADLRDAIDNGDRVTTLLNGLGDRRALLTDEDVKVLRAREKKVQGAAP